MAGAGLIERWEPAASFGSLVCFQDQGLVPASVAFQGHQQGAGLEQLRLEPAPIWNAGATALWLSFPLVTSKFVIRME